MATRSPRLHARAPQRVGQAVGRSCSCGIGVGSRRPRPSASTAGAAAIRSSPSGAGPARATGLRHVEPLGHLPAETPCMRGMVVPCRPACHSLTACHAPPYDRLMYQAKTNPRAASLSRSASLQYHVRSGASPPWPSPAGHGARLDGRRRVLPVRGGRLPSQDRWVIAPDWRGYGLTTDGGGRQLLVPDYIADLDFLLDHYAPSAGRPGGPQHGRQCGDALRRHPARTGPPARQPGGLWHARPRGRRRRPGVMPSGWTRSRPAPRRMALQPLRHGDGVARRLMKTNPRLARDQAGRDKADWLATHWAGPNAQGQWEILGDPAHKIVNANLYQRRGGCWSSTGASRAGAGGGGRATTAWAMVEGQASPWSRVPRTPEIRAQPAASPSCRRRPHAAPRPAASPAGRAAGETFWRRCLAGAA
jgi:hypothetical protein